MSTYVLAHGAWSSAFAWKRMRELMREAGHELYTPSLTGLGERSHLASPNVDLDTHIMDVVNVLHYEDLTDVRLIGHSYGGMVATGVLDRAADRIARVIYVDAFVPRDGQCLLDLAGDAAREKMTQSALQNGDGWRVKSNPLPVDTPADLAEWLSARRHEHPLGTLTQPVRLTGAGNAVPRDYIYCTRPMPGDGFAQFLARARSEAGWTAHEIDATHNPHITMPEQLVDLLMDIAGDR